MKKIITVGNGRQKLPLKRSTKRTIFYCLMMAIPVLQFCIFYIYVNLSAVSMAFKTYTETDRGYVSVFAGFANFVAIFKMLAVGNNMDMIWTSLAAAGITFAITMPLSLLFSYYLYKKFPLHGFFRIILFLPQVVSTVVMTLLFQYIVTDVYIALTGKEFGLLGRPESKYATLLFYNLWVGFGVNVLIYTGAMSGINESIVESAQLDGVNSLQEFWHITFPMIFPTFITFLITSIAGIFSNQLNLYTFFQQNSDIKTVGYYLFLQALESGPVSFVTPTVTYLSYPEVSAFGLMITAVIFPLTMLVRHLLQKFGPRVD